MHRGIALLRLIGTIMKSPSITLFSMTVRSSLGTFLNRLFLMEARPSRAHFLSRKMVMRRRAAAARRVLSTGAHPRKSHSALLTAPFGISSLKSLHCFCFRRLYPHTMRVTSSSSRCSSAAVGSKPLLKRFPISLSSAICLSLASNFGTVR